VAKAKVKFTLNKAGIANLGETVAAGTEAVINEVAGRMAGQPVEAVKAELVQKMQAVGIEPSEPGISALAEKISNAT
jgi:hypothetical protein